MDRAARAIFNVKWPVVWHVVRFHAKRLRIVRQDREDLEQIAALQTWRMCQRIAGGESFEINAQVVGMAAFSTWSWQRRDLAAHPIGYGRGSGSDDADELKDPIAGLAAAGDQIRLASGVTLTLTDVELDSPELIDLYVNGITGRQVAARLGITYSAVVQRAGQLGGRQFGRYWRFPVDTGLTAGAPRESSG